MPHRTRSQRPLTRAVAPLVGEPVVAVAPVALPGVPGRRLARSGLAGRARSSQAAVLAAVTDDAVHLFTCRVRAGRPCVLRHLETWDRRGLRVEPDGRGRRAGIRVEFPTWGRVVALRQPDVAADDLAEVVGFCFQLLATDDDRTWRSYA
jgi:hypothetical protein